MDNQATCLTRAEGDRAMPLTLMLTGPAGSGKSTAAAAWAARGTSPRALIDADGLRSLIRAGVAHPEHGWTQETQRQWNVAMDLWKSMVAVYREHHIDCVVDIYAPPCPPERGDTSMADFDIQRVVLFPGLDVCLERNRIRNREPFLKDEDLRRNYEDFARCIRQGKPANVIDNSALTVAETVAAIDAVLAHQRVVT